MAQEEASPGEPPRRDSAQEEDSSYEGSTLRIMWDEDAGPLWGDRGLLPAEPEWLRRALGLSDSLTDDLIAWRRDMSTWHRSPTAAGWQEQEGRLDDRREALAQRLTSEVGDRYLVWSHP